jgi:hypothetical protein
MHFKYGFILGREAALKILVKLTAGLQLKGFSESKHGYLLKLYFTCGINKFNLKMKLANLEAAESSNQMAEPEALGP